ncbi:GNAT family N-acetyltransferase [Jatrophihabitans endophyticus]|uniref:GNAT family N-acetyltransferase n=1 Tax=Jatrophihabitans endophyticus TaxID=1206085 RepID=UPI0026F221C0|nr:GNAT family N-acetyltransferase [Jatrophihabitans endophyticus]
MPLEIVARPYSDPDVTRLVAEVQAEYVTMYGGPDAAAVDPDEFVPPSGLLLVGLLDGEPVVTGGWRRLDGPTGRRAEIKRMYVRASARRRGLARTMLTELERTAADAGIDRLVLNTGSVQVAAVALYRQFGYTAEPGFGHYADQPGALFFGKDIRDEPAGS